MPDVCPYCGCENINFRVDTCFYECWCCGATFSLPDHVDRDD